MPYRYQCQTPLNTHGAQPSFGELPELPGRSTTSFAKEELLKEFPKPDLSKFKYRMEGKVGNERLMVRVYGKEKYYPLVTQIRGKEEYQIKQYLPKEVERALGKISSRKILEEEIKNLSDGIISKINKQQKTQVPA